MFIKRFILTLLLFFSFFLNAQLTSEWGSSKIINEMKKLNTVGSVLYIAAHPDDENTRLLAYLANEKHYRTGYLSLTRGDGGQNLIGKEQGEALGLIRTQELLAARRTDGAEQFFTRAKDFGFSKNPEETLTIWDKEQILADVVLTIRRFKPDVIICRFPTTGEGGHGHHTASAILAMEAFDAAADPTRFPEQLKETEVWQAKRILWNTFNFGGNNTTSPNQLKVDVGGFNPLLGLSYGEMAAMSRTMHKSQGFGTAMQRGENIEYFKFLKGEKLKNNLLEGVNTSWSRIANTTTLQTLLDRLESEFQPQHPEKSVKTLVEIYTSLLKLEEKDSYTAYWKTLKIKECKNLILACGGIWLEATADDYRTQPIGAFDVTTQVILRAPISVVVKSLNTLTNTPLIQNQPLINKTTSIKTADSYRIYSDPYWLREPVKNEIYTVKDSRLIGIPQDTVVDVETITLTIENVDLTYYIPIDYKYTDPIKGEVHRPLEVLPPVTINLSDKVLTFSGSEAKEISFTVTANQDKIDGNISIKAPEGWTITIPDPAVKLDKKGDEQLVKAKVSPSENGKDGMLEASVNIDGETYNKSITRIEYDHIPYQFFLSDANAKLVSLDLKKTNTKIGYIPGAGDDVATCLQQIGYDVTLLTNDLLDKEDLSVYSSIITGIRAYNVDKRLPLHYQKLMEYVKNGGNLIVQYNTNNRIAPLKGDIGPYPFVISRDRVTDETAKVKFTNPKHVVLNYPNIITEQDFDGWIQERGIYFADDTSKEYESILSMNDKGEKPNEGSLIIGKYGKGNFVYTGLVFFRELPAGVPGAYRLFVNLLSLPQNK